MTDFGFDDLARTALGGARNEDEGKLLLREPAHFE